MIRYLRPRHLADVTFRAHSQTPEHLVDTQVVGLPRKVLLEDLKKLEALGALSKHRAERDGDGQTCESYQDISNQIIDMHYKKSTSSSATAVASISGILPSASLAYNLRVAREVPQWGLDRTWVRVFLMRLGKGQTGSAATGCRRAPEAVRELPVGWAEVRGPTDPAS